MHNFNFWHFPNFCPPPPPPSEKWIDAAVIPQLHCPRWAFHRPCTVYNSIATYVGVNFAGAIIVVHLEQYCRRANVSSSGANFRSNVSRADDLHRDPGPIECPSFCPFIHDPDYCGQCLFLLKSPLGTVCTMKGEKSSNSVSRVEKRLGC